MIARRLVLLEDVPAEALLIAAEALLPPGFMAYEPETIRFEFADMDLDLPEINFEKLFAIQALIAQDNFFWDTDVFAQTCAVFNELPTNEALLPELSPKQIAWGVEQATRILEYKEPGVIPEELDLIHIFDDDPETYTALCCVEHSLFVPPEELGFAREALKHIVPADEELVSEVKKAWADIGNSDPAQVTLTESAVDVQLAQMFVVRMYCQSRREMLRQTLELL